MRSFFVLLFLVVMTALSSSEDSNLFSSNNDMWFDEAERNMSDDFFVNESELNVADNPFVNDNPLNIEESYLTKQVSDDFLLADEYSDCPLLSLPSGRTRERSDSCTAKTETYLEVKKDEDVKKYWCSKGSVLGFANIPVCNLLALGVRPSEQTPWPDNDFPSIPSGFVNLALCRISKFIHVWGTFALTASLKTLRARGS